MATAAGGSDPAAFCRFYEKTFPSEGDLVMCRIVNTDQDSGHVHLLEYNNLEGMIRFTELSRRRIRSLSKFIRIGKQEVYQVLTVDASKGYIDLSKRKVTGADISQCDDGYNKAKAVNSLLGQVFRQHRMPAGQEEPARDDQVPTLEHLYERIAWPLGKLYGSVFDALKHAVLAPEKVFSHECLKRDGKFPDPKVIATLKEVCKERLKAQPFKIRAVIECSCLTVEGIEAIKEVLREGEKRGTEEHPLKIRLNAPPMYTVNTISPDKESGVALVMRVITEMTALMEKKRGSLKLAQAATVVSDDSDIRGRYVGAPGSDDESEYEEDEEDEEDDDDDAFDSYEDPAVTRAARKRR